MKTFPNLKIFKVVSKILKINIFIDQVSKVGEYFTKDLQFEKYVTQFSWLFTK